jgi:quercetin dioxygenase-like cupin family protein
MSDTLEIAGVRVVHHFGGGAYAKETIIPAGVTLVQHSHPHDHLSILAFGRVIVRQMESQEVFRAPKCITIKAGVSHSVEAIDDSVWYCIHATDDTDPASVDRSILVKGA